MGQAYPTCENPIRISKYWGFAEALYVIFQFVKKRGESDKRTLSEREE